MTQDAWQIFPIEELLEKVQGSDPKYHEFLRVPSLSCGIYRLPAGARDMQAPHLEDEVYYVLEGQARLRTEDGEHAVRPGSILYVRATAEHSFFDIESDLTLIAFFGATPPIWD
jgi:mannose-6-phosphate isomerase-like protein (cupin superfamily)